MKHIFTLLAILGAFNAANAGQQEQLQRLAQVSVTAQDNKQITVPAQVLEKIQNKEVKEVIDDQEIVGNQVFINLPSDLLEQFTLLIEHDNTQAVLDRLFEDEAPLNRANKLWRLANNIETIVNHLQVNLDQEKIDEISIKTACKANRIGLNLTNQDLATYNQNTTEQNPIEEKRLFKTSDNKWLFVSQETLDYLCSNAIDPALCNYKLLNLLITVINNDYSCSLLEKRMNHLLSLSLVDAHIFIKNLNGNTALASFTQQLKLEMAQRYRHKKVLVNEIIVNDHQECIWSAQLSADGNTLMTQSPEKVMVRNAQTSAVLYAVTQGDAHGHQELIFKAQLSTDGNTLMTRSADKVMVHKLQQDGTYRNVLTVNRGDFNGHQQGSWNAQLSTDGTTLMTGSINKVMVCNTQTRALLCTVTRSNAGGHQELICSAQLNSDGTTLMTQSHDKVMVCNTQTRAVLFTVDRDDANGHKWNINSAQLSTDGTTLTTFSHDRAMLHNLPITAHSIQKPLSKFIAVIKFFNKAVSIYQQDFTEELARDLSLEQIYAAIYAQQHNQEFPKISIIFAGKNDQMQAIFIEAPEVINEPAQQTFLQRAAAFASQYKTAIAVTSGVVTTGIEAPEVIIEPIINPIEPVIVQTPIQEPAQQTFLQRAAAFASQHKTAIAVTSGIVATGAVLYAGPTATYQAAKDKIKSWFSK